MGAVTPSTTVVENIGSLKLIVATFAATVDPGDTWASGISDIVAYWAVSKQANTTNTTSGVGVAESSGTFTLYHEVANTAVILFIVARGA